LSERFQLAENIRMFRIAKRCIRVAGVATFAFVAFFSTSTLLLDEGYSELGLLINNVTYCTIPMQVTSD
jgi:hypothetical protein